MLRCCHVASVRAGLESRIALKIPLNPSWVRAPQKLLPLAQRFPASRPLAVGSLIAARRPYSINPEVIEQNIPDDETSANTQATQATSTTDGKRQPRHKKREEDPLLQAAMSRGPLEGQDGRRISRKVVEMELRWLKDPRALADRVGRLLNAGDVALAVELIRTAQKDQMECSVAWNHLLEYCMDQKSPGAAFKFYNDMKKRGRKPNSRTYTIMLDGLSKAGKYSGLDPVRTALSIYRSIFVPSSGIEPHIIHSNAMLGVCGRHGDMDSLWEVAGELPEDGPGSPDSFTYTIILKALRESAQRDVSKLDPNEFEKIFARKAQVVKEAKRVWSDIVYRWRKGELLLDGHVVGAMAGVLLEGTGDRHFYEVFALFHQTAGIPILAKEPAPDAPRPARGERVSRNRVDERIELEDVPFVDDEGRLYETPKPAPETAEAEEVEENFEKLFKPVVSPEITPSSKPYTLANTSSVPTYIALGNRELSMILETCLAMTQAVSVGKAYWEHLTQGEHEYRIEPDAGSFHQYLRLLRLGRSSRTAVELVRDQMVPASKADGKAFHIALSCCRRDRNNLNVLKNANELLKAMNASLVLPDPRALEGYLELIRVLEENPQFLVSLNGLDINKKPHGSLEAMGRKLQLNLLDSAIKRLWPFIAKLNKAMEHGHISRAVANSHSSRRDNTQKVPGAAALKALNRTRALVDTYLKLDGSGFLSKTARQQLEQRSKELRKYSRMETLEKYKTALIAPTADQVLAHRKKHQPEASPEGQERTIEGQ